MVLWRLRSCGYVQRWDAMRCCGPRLCALITLTQPQTAIPLLPQLRPHRSQLPNAPPLHASPSPSPSARPRPHLFERREHHAELLLALAELAAPDKVRPGGMMRKVRGREGEEGEGARVMGVDDWGDY